MSDLTPRLLMWSFADAASLDSAAEQLIAHHSVTELLPIRTCQRNELIALVSGDNVPALVDALQTLDSSDAVTRLFAIAAGALSEIPGERAVADQLRSQLRLALRRRQAGTVLAKLTRRALASGGTLRERASESATLLELADLVIALARSQHSRGQQPAGIIIIGAGAVGRSIHKALTGAGIVVHAWATRHPKGGAAGPDCSIDEALTLAPANGIVIVALGDGASPIRTDQLPAGVTTIDLSMPPVVKSATMTLRNVIDSSHDLLQPQRDAVERAAHRLKARAEAALAETLCPEMTAINEAIARFRQAIIDAEYRRLAPALEKMSVEEAERMRRSIRHTAARCVHPIHEYVNTLGRQGRVDEARTVVDHLLGTRVGVMIESENEGECETRRQSPRTPVRGL